MIGGAFKPCILLVVSPAPPSIHQPFLSWVLRLTCSVCGTHRSSSERDRACSLQTGETIQTETEHGGSTRSAATRKILEDLDDLLIPNISSHRIAANLAKEKLVCSNFGPDICPILLPSLCLSVAAASLPGSVSPHWHLSPVASLSSLQLIQSRHPNYTCSLSLPDTALSERLGRTV